MGLSRNPLRHGGSRNDTHVFNLESSRYFLERNDGETRERRFKETPQGQSELCPNDQTRRAATRGKERLFRVDGLKQVRAQARIEGEAKISRGPMNFRTQLFFQPRIQG